MKQEDSLRTFSQSKFLSFSQEKQAREIVIYAHGVEKLFAFFFEQKGQGAEGELLLKSLEQLQFYLNWRALKEEKDYELFKNLQSVVSKCLQSFRSSTEKFLEDYLQLGKEFVVAVVPLERIYYRAVKDNEISVRSEDKAQAVDKVPLVFILHNIRSTFNIGSFFRTAECLGCEEIYLCGYTATADHPGVQKTSMGTSEMISWRYQVSVEKSIEDLKERGYHILALETAESAVNLYDLQLEMKEGETPRLALVFGNEYFGLEQRVLDLADEIVEVPVFGRKNSLNVSICGSVCGYELIRRFYRGAK